MSTAAVSTPTPNQIHTLPEQIGDTPLPILDCKHPDIYTLPAEDNDVDGPAPVYELDVRCCRQCQAAVVDCICDSPKPDKARHIPLFRFDGGYNARLAKHLNAKARKHAAVREARATKKTLLDYALDCIRRGWYVFPCAPRLKTPATGHGWKDATLDEAIVRAWWTENPNFNPAIALGPSGLVVYDYDGIAPFENMPTFRVRTGRPYQNGKDGIQDYYVGSCKTRGYKKGLDPVESDGGGEVRSRGAYVMAPGAVHPSGDRYAIISDLPLAPSPENNEIVITDKVDIADEELQNISYYVEQAFDQSGVEFKSQCATSDEEGYVWHIVCPWLEEHTGQDASGSVVILWKSGMLIYKCHHAHCSGIRQWKELRAYMEEKAGTKLRFVDPSPQVIIGKRVLTGTAVEQVSENLPKTVLMSHGLQVPDKAFHGIAGRIIAKIQPETESHPVGNLIEFLAGIGNLIGRGPHFKVESSFLFTNLAAVKVGKSSKARKGTGKDRVFEILKRVDPVWSARCLQGGLGSGEVIVTLIKDDRMVKRFNKLVLEKGVDEKRAYFSEGEFKGILANTVKRESQMSRIIREACDSKPLFNSTKKDGGKLACMEPHVSIMCDCTAEELNLELSNVDRQNGFANRFLWCFVERQHLLPDGGEDIDWAAEVAELREIVEFARKQGRIFRDRAARDFWHRIYADLSKEQAGIVGMLTGRAEALVMRLALIYALLDRSEVIRVEHLEAALALWQYCRDSVSVIFEGTAVGDQARILDYCTEDRTSADIIQRLFKRNRRATGVQGDLDAMVADKRLTKTGEGEAARYRKAGQ